MYILHNILCKIIFGCICNTVEIIILQILFFNLWVRLISSLPGITLKKTILISALIKWAHYCFVGHSRVLIVILFIPSFLLPLPNWPKARQLPKIIHLFLGSPRRVLESWKGVCPRQNKLRAFFLRETKIHLAVNWKMAQMLVNLEECSRNGQATCCLFG